MDLFGDFNDGSFLFLKKPMQIFHTIFNNGKKYSPFFIKTIGSITRSYKIIDICRLVHLRQLKQ